MMKIIHELLILAAVLVVACASASKELAAGEEIDITHEYVVGEMPLFLGGPEGLPKFYVPHAAIKHGDVANTINFTMNTQWGTHVVAPGFINQTLLQQGHDVDSLDLYTLNGLCLVVETPRDQNITAEVMEGLNIARGVERLLFKTLNTDRKLMYSPRFDSSYTALTPDGAQYLVSHTDIKLVGIDYLSVGVGVKEEYKAVYLTLLNTKEIIPVQGLKLDDVEQGVYELDCSPLRFPTFPGSPARCVLTTVG